MEIFELIFDLGVLIAIYSFIWFFIDLAITLLVSGRKRTDEEIYLVRAIKYLFLANVVFMFSGSSAEEIHYEKLIPCIVILLVYFFGKFQRKQKQQAAFKQLSNFSIFRFNLKYEVLLIALSMGLFLTFVFMPDIASNNIATWFQTNIRDINKAFLFGFIFKIVGFFFLLNMLMKMINSINYVLSGKPLIDFKTFVKTEKRQSEDKFDDFEEL